MIVSNPRRALFVALLLAFVSHASAAAPRALPDGAKPDDHRLGPLRTLDGYFPMQPVADAAAWPARRAEIRQRVLTAAGLIPMPTRTPLKPIVYGRVERDDYTVDRVIIESMPGHYVTGSLYRPKGASAEHGRNADGKRPGILCPHGHWPDGRFYDAGEKQVRQAIADGGERFLIGGRHPIQARCVQLARMGCIVFAYDMEGYADSVQLPHRPGVRPVDPHAKGDLFFSPLAEMHLQNMMGLQTWNSIRALDFISSLDEVDHDRIACTGASGGATQTLMLTAVDDRVRLAFPAVMVSTAMQGGCTCENAPYLRIGQGNIDIAAAAAPRPLGMTSADDWTHELAEKGFPDLQSLYTQLGVKDHVAMWRHLQFKHNYNAMNRRHMYAFVNRFFHLGFDEPILERDYQPLTRAEATVWTDQHPKPAGDQVGEAHERKLLAWWVRDVQATLAKMSDVDRRATYAAALHVIIGRSLDEVGDVRWDLSDKIDQGDHLLMTGTLTVVDHHEQLPAMFLYPKDQRRGDVVICLTDAGKSGLLDANDQPTPPIAKLLAAGFTVASIDMMGQGEFTADGKAITSTPLVDNGKQPWQKACEYTFGYNEPLLCQRVHDVMSLVHFLHSDTKHGGVPRIELMGVGPQAGVVALAARTQLADRITRMFIDTRGFHFTQVDRFDAPMFVPGILRYGGVEGLRFVCGNDAVQQVDGEAAMVDKLLAQ